MITDKQVIYGSVSACSNPRHHCIVSGSRCRWCGMNYPAALASGFPPCWVEAYCEAQFDTTSCGVSNPLSISGGLNVP
jgi:hypothetical protein